MVGIDVWIRVITSAILLDWQITHPVQENELAFLNGDSQVLASSVLLIFVFGQRSSDTTFVVTIEPVGQASVHPPVQLVSDIFDVGMAVVLTGCG